MENLQEKLKKYNESLNGDRHRIVIWGELIKLRSALRPTKHFNTLEELDEFLTKETELKVGTLCWVWDDENDGKLLYFYAGNNKWISMKGGKGSSWENYEIVKLKHGLIDLEE